MGEEDSIKEESTLTLKDKREQKIKEKLLDEAFKKAEISRGLRRPDSKTPKKSYEKTFPKLGVLLIILATFGLIFINNAPWAFISYDAEYGSVGASFHRDLENIDIEHQKVLKLFESPYYIGLSTGDFTYTPILAFYGFISLVMIGIVITIFGIIDKKLDFSIKTFTITHFILAAVAIIPCVSIVLSVMKFLSAHLLLYYNISLIHNLIPDINITFLTFPVAFILIALGFIVIKLEFTVMKIDLNELQKIAEVDTTSKKSFSKYVFGSGLQ